MVHLHCKIIIQQGLRGNEIMAIIKPTRNVRLSLCMFVWKEQFDFSFFEHDSLGPLSMFSLKLLFTKEYQVRTLAILLHCTNPNINISTNWKLNIVLLWFKFRWVWKSTRKHVSLCITKDSSMYCLCTSRWIFGQFCLKIIVRFHLMKFINMFALEKYGAYIWVNTLGLIYWKRSLMDKLQLIES